MALRIKYSRFEWYVPLYGGNRARYLDGADDVCQVELRIPTFETVQSFRRGPKDFGTVSRFLAQHIGQIVGLEVEAAEEGQPPTAVKDGAALMALSADIDADIILELNDALGSAAVLDLGLKKKLSRPPGSGASSPESDGTAQVAAPTDCTLSHAATATAESATGQ